MCLHNVSSRRPTKYISVIPREDLVSRKCRDVDSSGDTSDGGKYDFSQTVFRTTKRMTNLFPCRLTLEGFYLRGIFIQALAMKVCCVECRRVVASSVTSLDKMVQDLLIQFFMRNNAAHLMGGRNKYFICTYVHTCIQINCILWPRKRNSAPLLSLHSYDHTLSRISHSNRNKSRRHLNFAHHMSMITDLTTVKLVSDFIRVFNRREGERGRGGGETSDCTSPARISRRMRARYAPVAGTKACAVSRIASHIRQTSCNIFAVRITGVKLRRAHVRK